MKEFNLVELLKNCPVGIKLYSRICGDCFLRAVDLNKNCIIVTNNNNNYVHLYNGAFFCEDGECLLFPSREELTWENFNPDLYLMIEDKIVNETCKWVYSNILLYINLDENKNIILGNFENEYKQYIKEYIKQQNTQIQTLKLDEIEDIKGDNNNLT